MAPVSRSEDLTRHTDRPVAAAAAPDDDALMAVGQRLIVGHVMDGVLHDFNNSLQIISGLAELLLRRADLPPTSVEKLETIADRTVTAAASVARMQMLSRPTDGRASEIDVRQLVAEALDLRRHAMSRMGITGRLEPITAGGCHVRSDTARLRLALLGLLVHAEQIVRGQRDGEVVVAVSRRVDRVVVHVRTSVPRGLETARVALDASSVGLDAGTVGVTLRLVRAVAIAEGGTLTVVDRLVDGEALCLDLPAAHRPAQATECSSSSF